MNMARTQQVQRQKAEVKQQVVETDSKGRTRERRKVDNFQDNQQVRNYYNRKGNSQQDCLYCQWQKQQLLDLANGVGDFTPTAINDYV